MAPGLPLMRRRREIAIPARRGVDGRKDDAELLVARIYLFFAPNITHVFVFENSPPNARGGDCLEPDFHRGSERERERGYYIGYRYKRLM